MQGDPLGEDGSEREADHDEVAGQIGDRCQRTSVEFFVPELSGVLACFRAGVKAATLIDVTQGDRVPGRFEALDGVQHIRADAEH